MTPQNFFNRSLLLQQQKGAHSLLCLAQKITLLDGGMKWNGKPRFPIPFHTSIQQRPENYAPPSVARVIGPITFLHFPSMLPPYLWIYRYV